MLSALLKMKDKISTITAQASKNVCEEEVKKKKIMVTTLIWMI